MYKALTQIKNVIKYHKKNIQISNIRNQVLPLLKHLYLEGFIQTFQFKKDKNILQIFLRVKEGRNIINNIRIFPTGKKALHVPYKTLWSYTKNGGCLILSTSIGILSHKTCMRKRIGGQALLFIS